MKHSLLPKTFLIILLFLIVIYSKAQTAEDYIKKGIEKYIHKYYSEALQDFNNAIKLNPKFTDALVLRADTKYKLGNKEGACLDWSKAGELGDTEAYDMIKKNCK